MMQKTRVHRIGIGIAISLSMVLQVSVSAAEPLDVNDVSFLWPFPNDVASLSTLISADETLDDGSLIWEQRDFDRVLQESRSLTDPGRGFSVTFPSGEGIEQRSNWKVAGIRVDPCAPGLHAGLGETPQIRLILQPVDQRPTNIRVHDITAHLAFDFAASPRTPDVPKFTEIVSDLVAIREAMKVAGVSTKGALNVHPGFKAAQADLPGKLKGFLKKHLRSSKLNAVAFMGVQRPEPWIFGFFVRQNGVLTTVPLRTAGGQRSIALNFRRSPKVNPTPTNLQFGNFGVSTADLFNALPNLSTEVGASPHPAVGRRIRASEIPDIIANPKFCNPFNTDCVSCHTETSLRNTRNLPPADMAFRVNATPPDAAVQPQGLWNVRNFGWGIDAAIGERKSTATVRVANEAAESVEVINAKYLGSGSSPVPAPATPAAGGPANPSQAAVSNPLTLVMKAKSAAEYKDLKEKISKIQDGPQVSNPIRNALERLGTVHFARFVFIDEFELVMVITTFDDSFTAYLDQFIDEIGEVFDLILSHVKDAPPLPVRDNRLEFHNFVEKHDVKPVGGLYSAYPDMRASEIRRLSRQPAASGQ